MKKSLKTSSFLLLFICCIVQLNAQQSKDIKRNGIIKNIQFEKNQQPNVQEAQNILKQKLEMNDSDRFILLKKTDDDLGFSHERYQQYHKGIKVEFGTYIVHSKNNKVQTMNGDFFPMRNIKTNPSISEEQALNFALANINANSYMWESAENEKYAAQFEPAGTYKPQGELVIVKQLLKKGQASDLAYKFDIYAENPISRDHVYVNAHTGEVVFKNQIIKHCFHGAGEHTSSCSGSADHNHKEAVDAAARTVADFFITGSAATRYSGTRSIETTTTTGGYRLRDNTRGNGVNTYDCNTGTSYNNAVDFVDNDNNWTSGEWNNAQKDNAALDAHWGAEMTYDYFVEQHNRNSYNGSGAAINSYVHYSSNYDNAFWDGSRMTYGDGNSFDALTSLDVAAHEIGHAVCSNTANLVYSCESGALNEAFSDIWAACVEDLKTTGKQPYLIGEDIGPNGSPLRNMINPNAEGQPDTYLGTSWYSGSGDNGGVHYNSGVLNHCFYILSAGNSGTNDNGDSYSVPAIGIIKAGKIFYRAEAVYLSSNSQYADARTACIQAATDLYGAGSNEVCSTTNAFYAVGVGASSSCAAPTCNDGIQNGNETGVDCGGPDCADCPPCTNVTVTINLDNYPTETSWSITSGGTTLASGGGYSTANSTTSSAACLVDGCYNFTINDTYGDGICCGFGNGSYTVTDANGTVLASGGSFTSTETTQICITSTPACTVGASCNDGDPCTTGDVYDANCGCAGTFADADGDGTCDANDLCTGPEPGSSCDDGDATTTGDVVQSDCSCAGTPTSGGCDTYTDQFDSGWGNWNDGGSDCARVNGYANSGSISVRIRDNSGVGSSTTSDPYDLSSSGGAFTISWSAIANSMETGEDYWFQYSYDGTTFTTLQTFASGTDFTNGVRENLSFSYTGVTAPIYFRFRCDASANADQVYLDDVIVTTCTSLTITQGDVLALNPASPNNIVASNSFGKDELEADEINIFPNPTKDILNVSFAADSKEVSISIFNQLGQVVMTKNVNGGANTTQLSVSDLIPGNYFITVIIDGERSVQKFVKY